MAGGYEPGKSADLMFRVTTTMTIALDEDNETSGKKHSSLSKTIVTLSVPTIISDVVSIGSDPKLDDWIQLNYEHTVFCSSNLDEFLELKVRHYTRNLFLLSEKKTIT